MRDMEKRNPLHQLVHQQGGMAATGQVIRVPLLPYERQLIEVLGISREEYEQFSLEVARLSKERPAEYAHIPDIQAAVPVAVAFAAPLLAGGGGAAKGAALTTAAISLAVGTAVSAAAYLLLPKPKPFTAANQSFGGQQVALESVTGQERFSPTFGFDSQQSLATYGTPIPLVFTDILPDIANGSKGLLISPLLVWSRVISRGNYQIAEMQFLVGQGPLPIRTDWSTASGKYGNLFLGGNTIDASSVEDFAFYYRDGSATDNRFGREHLKAGNLYASVPLAFTAPTNVGDEIFAFSSTFSPSSQAQFGVYSGIPNATNLRLNWQVISQDVKTPEPERDWSPLDIRNWISGPQKTHDDMYNAGMSGTGTNYARRVGIIRTTSSDVKGTIPDKKGGTTKATIYRGVDGGEGVGTEITIVIGAGVQSDKFGSINWSKRDPYSANQGKDIQNILDGEHATHDDALQVGEQFMIGTGLWMVTKKSGFWDKTKNRRVEVTLRCIKRLSGFSATGALEPVTFGIANSEAISQELPPYVGTTDDEGNATFIDSPPFAVETFTTKDRIIDEAFFPICKASVATVQNTRPCDVTEIGLKSQVWLRFNNLCNFSTIPSPEQLRKADGNRTMYQTGTMNKYARRVSLFSLDIREAGSAADAVWHPSGRTFAVQGETPTDAYNYIRVYHGTTRALEFRLRPRTSADAVYINGPDWEVVLLDASKDNVYEWSQSVDGRTMQFKTNGEIKTIKELWGLTEMGAPYISVDRAPTTTPKTVSFASYGFRSVGIDPVTKDPPSYEDISKAWQFMLAYRPSPEYYDNPSNPDTWRYSFNALVESTSPPVLDVTTGIGKTYYDFYDPTRHPSGTTFTVLEAYKPSATNTVVFEFKVDVAYIDGVKRWKLLYATVRSAGTGWKVGDRIPKGLIQGYYSGAKVLEAIFLVSTVGEIDVTPPTEKTRTFGKYTAIAEVSQYASEIQRSCDNGPEHQISYVNESIKDPVEAKYPRCAMAGLRLRSGRSFNSLDQFRLFATKGLQIPTLPLGTTSKPVASSKYFSDIAYYLLTNTETGAGELADGLVDEEQMRKCRKFLETNKFHYNDAITESINIRTFLGQVAPSMLCSVVVRNGRFSVEPAIPFNPVGGEISVGERVPVSAMFTSGNIIEDTFTVEYLGAEERKDFTAVVRWRQHNENEFPQSKAVLAYYSDLTDDAQRPVEEFDLRWIDNLDHALKAAKYFLAIRRQVTHVVKFKTTPLASVLNPGSYIIVSTDSNPYTPVNNGVVLDDGTIISANDLTASATPLDIYFWRRGSDAVETGTMVVEAGTEAGTFKTKSPRDVIFAVKTSGVRNNCYMVESITLDEDGMVDVTATHFPLDADGKSLIARDVVDVTGAYIKTEEL